MPQYVFKEFSYISFSLLFLKLNNEYDTDEKTRNTWWVKMYTFHIIGCVRLASLGRPRSAHSGEPLTRANRTITLALSRWRHAPQVTPKWPAPQGHWGLTGVDPGKLNERTHYKHNFCVCLVNIVRTKVVCIRDDSDVIQRPALVSILYSNSRIDYLMFQRLE